jgi:hypothetical protein
MQPLAAGAPAADILPGKKGKTHKNAMEIMENPDIPCAGDNGGTPASQGSSAKFHKGDLYPQIRADFHRF